MSKKNQQQVEPKEVKEMEEDEMTKEASQASEPTEVKEKKKYFTKENAIKACTFVFAVGLGCILGHSASKLGGKSESCDDCESESSYEDSYTDYEQPVETTEL